MIIYAYIGILFILTILGLKLSQYFKIQTNKIIAELNSVITTRPGKEIIKNLTSNLTSVIISNENQSKNYFSPDDKVFYLSKEVANSANGSSVAIIIYVILLKNMMERKIIKSYLNLLKKVFSELFILIFAIIALLSASYIFLFLSITIYIIVLLLELIINGFQYFINKGDLTKFLELNGFHLDQKEIDSAIKYIEHRKKQSVVLFLFNPILIPAYYFYFVFGGKSEKLTSLS